MNVAVINLKDITKYFFKMFFIILIIFLSVNIITNSKYILQQILLNKANTSFLSKCLEITIPVFNTSKNNKKNEFKLTNLINMELSIFNSNYNEIKTDNPNQLIEEISETIEKTETPKFEISKVAQTVEVNEKNHIANSTNSFGTTKIDNQSSYTITEEMLIPDVEITNKKDILIYHTHTCESYTPCETYNYQMTGNYRTTDSNYNVIRVGTELTTYLTQKGFAVTHDGTYHDYPAYSGSYSRSLETAQKLLEEKNTEIVIDLHRDALGNGDTYGPTVMINGIKVAQLMFVIGTDGGGLEHSNWKQNLKIAVKIQETANKMYPGLFRPIIIRNSRYNQHLAKGASIIEVGATANSLGECLLSMQCLANIFEETLK